VRLESVLLPGNDLNRVREWGKERRFFIDDALKTKLITMLKQVAPNAATLVIEEADRICDHVFDLLGSGPTPLGKKIDWHRDFKTGHRWNPKTYYKRIHPAPYPGGYDIKVPWELSRCQHFVRLGQAYWITGDEKYSREFVAQVEDWIANNPRPWGVNWACTMDVAIRVVNLLWGYNFFRESASLSNEFLLSFNKSMLIHGWHIRSNLENSGNVTNNHYLADLVGLIYLGILCPEFKEAAEWREFGLRELCREMFKQVYPDGVSFEASIAYHRLATELFLSPVLLCRLNDISVPDEVMARLEKMLEFVMYYTKPDGSVPMIGDADNGRVHRLTVRDRPEQEWLDHRYLLAIGAVLYDREDFAQAAGEQWQEAIWVLGPEAADFRYCIESKRLLPLQLGSRGFAQGGLYIMRDDGLHIVVNASGNGQNGKGGHSHNDALSFELFVNGQTWIFDSGTYVYTADYEARHRFRSTAAHNTVEIDNEEQNRSVSRKPFNMNEDAHPAVLGWAASVTDIKLVAEHSGYTRLPSPIVHRREFCVDKAARKIVIRDYLVGAGRHNIKARWVFTTALDLKDSPSEIILADKHDKSVTIRWRDLAIAQVDVSTVSFSYGSLVEARRLSLTKPEYDSGILADYIFEMSLQY
jgi:uncharacterized heparinase superfamily protein